MDIFAGLKESTTAGAEIYIVSQQELAAVGISLQQFFKGFSVVIQCPQGIFDKLNQQMLFMALRQKRGGPEDLLTKWR